VIRIEEMQVFDRWGERVFTRADFEPNIPELGWDGSFRGSPIQPATFVYVLKLELINGEVQIQTGDITLIR
jgi:hypothetical protein